MIIAGAGIADTVFSPSVDSSGEPVDPGKTFAMVSFGPLIDYYPDPEAGLHVEAGVGFGVTSGVPPKGADGTAASGLGLFGGVGYERWIADQWALGGLVRVHYVRAHENADTLLLGGYDVEHRALAFALLFVATYN